MNQKAINIIRNVLAVVIGLYLGGQLNMAIITYGSPYFPAPDGVNVMDIESIKANMHLYEFKHFVVPFLAHALGTFVGALLVGLIAASYKVQLAMIIGAAFLVGGIMMIYMIPTTPIWFIALDLLVAYLPMAWLGGTLGSKIYPSSSLKQQ